MEIDYRTHLTAMLDVTRFLLKQGLPFRGHDESTSSSNREITLAIINDIEDKFFSLMVYEARDSSVKEHMGVVLRFVNKKGCVIERFLAVVHVPDTSSHSLKMAIDALFVQHDLSLSRLRGQGYDGASNMRGILVQKLVETEKHSVFPLVYRMIELALVLPVATTSVERVFSAMKTVKTDLCIEWEMNE
ncbi:uncharacterized protein LOC122004213 [Zingiber officinale]|uniref:uncharacterized protein LOC122004213 n=1 Tax=Zingiber officinale TaxID=94328 RepID=UPI001C4D96A4|nr:uncharacterized protein LOC122004213 [Zingiber officinale]